MERTLNILKKILAILFAILFVITAIAGLVFFNLDRKAFTADTYKRVFANEGFYNRLPKVLAETVNSASFNENELPFVMRGMGLEAWEAFFRAMLPQETLIKMGDETLRSMFAYLNMETTSAQMSLLPLKESMASDAGVDAVYSLLNTQPECTLVQVAQMTVNLLSAESIQFCKPPPELFPVLTPIFRAQMEVTARALPDEVTLASAEGVPPENDPRVRLNNVRGLMRLTPLIPLGILLLLTLLMVNSLNSWLDWWGVPFLITGVTAVLMSLSGATIIGGILRRAITQRAPAYLPEAFSTYASDLAAAMVQTLTRPILWQGLTLALIGLVMVIVSNGIRQKQKNLPASEQPTMIE